MGNRRIILIFLLVIFFCVTVLFLTRKGSRLIQPKQKTFVTLVDGPLDQVDHITIDRGVSRVGLIQMNDRWVMTAPFSAAVDQAAVLRFLDAIEGARVLDSLSYKDLHKRGLSLREFGLRPPRGILVLEGNDGRRIFHCGFNTPTGNGFYIQPAGVEQVFVISDQVEKAIPRDADVVRSKKLVDDDLTHAVSIEIRSPGNPFIHLQFEKGNWSLRQPLVAPASGVVVKHLLDLLVNAEIDHFILPTVSNVLDVAQTESAMKTRCALYGLDDENGLQVQISTAENAKPIRWVFGNEQKEQGALTYALLQNGEAIGLVSNGVADAFRVKPSNLRDLRLFHERPSDVRELNVSCSGIQLTLGRDQGIWKISAPVSAPADQQVVSQVVDQLLNLEALSIQEFDPQQDVPEFSKIELVSSKARYTFLILRDDLPGKHLNVFFPETKTVYAVNSAGVPSVILAPGALLTLRDKTLLSLSSASIRRVQGKSADGQIIKVERDKEDSPWSISRDGMRGVFQKDAFDSLIRLLGQLQPVRIEKLGITLEDLETYGFRKPWYELNVDVESADAVRKSVLIGKPVDETNRYAMIRGQNMLVVLDAKTIAALTTPFVQKVKK